MGKGGDCRWDIFKDLMVLFGCTYILLFAFVALYFFYTFTPTHLDMSVTRFIFYIATS